MVRGARLPFHTTAAANRRMIAIDDPFNARSSNFGVSEHSPRATSTRGPARETTPRGSARGRRTGIRPLAPGSRLD